MFSRTARIFAKRLGPFELARKRETGARLRSKKPGAISPRSRFERPHRGWLFVRSAAGISEYLGGYRRDGRAAARWLRGNQTAALAHWAAAAGAFFRHGERAGQRGRTLPGVRGAQRNEFARRLPVAFAFAATAIANGYSRGLWHAGPSESYRTARGGDALRCWPRERPVRRRRGFHRRNGQRVPSRLNFRKCAAPVVPKIFAPLGSLYGLSAGISRMRAKARRTCGMAIEPPTISATLSASITSSRFHPSSPQRSK